MMVLYAVLATVCAAMSAMGYEQFSLPGLCFFFAYLCFRKAELTKQKGTTNEDTRSNFD